MNTQQTGNANVSSDFLKVLLTLKKNIMRDLASSELAIVQQINGDAYKCSILTNSKTVIECVKANDLTLQQGDVVLITFTKSDFRPNLKRYKNNQPLIDNQAETLHSLNYGVITSLIYRKETTE